MRRSRSPVRFLRLAAGAGLLIPIAALVVALPLLAPAGLPRAHAASRPNIVLILTDDQSRDTMPVLSWLNGQKDWTRFTAAEDSTSLCCPSRSSILSGQYEWHTGVTNNHGPNGGQNLDERQTVATALSAAGYDTGLFGKYLNGYPFTSYGRTPCYVPPGWTDFEAVRGAVNYWHDTLCANGTPVDYGSKTVHEDAGYLTNVVFSRAQSFITSAAAAGKPFFAYIAPKASHEPWQPEDRYAGASVPLAANPSLTDVGTAQPSWLAGRTAGLTPNQVAERQDEERTLLTVDDRVHELVDFLKAGHLLNNTVLVFMTDNGWSWGHGFVGKWCELEDCSATPLLVRDPFAATRTITDPVMNVDLASTFADLAGANMTDHQDGVSLVPLLSGGHLSRPGVLLDRRSGTARTDYTGIREGTFKYVEFRDGERSMYDLTADPFELHNIAGLPGSAAMQSQLAADLLAQERGSGWSAN